MEPSRFNIVSRIKNSESSLILNSLYGSADIIDGDTALYLENNIECNAELSEKGYLVDPVVEKSVFRNAYTRFIEDRETDEIQLFFVPGYDCNFGCDYCYQAEYENIQARLEPEVISAFFEYVDSEFRDRKKYITLFGGEPLLPGKSRKVNIARISELATKRSIDIAVVTNGYHIDEYIDILRKSRVREVQVTLDGTREVHNKRRSLKNGKGTFDKIVDGIDLLLENSIPVNLRMVIDKDNIADLQHFAQFAIEKGWTGSQFFKTQLGRNYELHECRHNNENLFTRIETYRELYRLIQKFPHILKFHKPSFSISGYLAENGELPPPLFDSCPGAKTEWAFDYTGNFYACTATIGKKGEELGRFYPEKIKNTLKIEEWSDRDILSIKECRVCTLSLLCGGGCAAVAKNRNGSGNSPDCRPVKELLELGIAAYFKDKL